MASKRLRSADGDATAAEMVKRRRFYTVPKDQQKILDRGNASYQNLVQRPGGLQHNIPSGAIDGLLAKHHRKKLAEDEAEKSSDLPPSTHQPLCNSYDQRLTMKETRQSSASRGQHDSTKSSNPQLLQSPSPSSPPERRMSWSPSPESHRFRAGALVPEKVAETPVSQRPNPECAVVKTRSQIDYNNFPSSDGPEDELEVDIPDAQKSFGPPINVPAIHPRHLASSPLKHIHMMQNTPPCAQPPSAVIPSTLDQGIRMPDHNEKQPRKKLCWRPVLFSDEEMTPEKPTNARTRMPTTKAFEMESSNSTESSMVVPATLEPRHHEPLIHGDHVQARPAFTEVTCQAAAEPDFSQEGRHAATKGGRRNSLVPHVTELEGSDEEQHSPAIADDEFCSQAPLTEVRDRTPASSIGRLAADVPVDNKPQATISGKSPSKENALQETMDPYKHFTDVYPSYESVYNGCFLHFIHATALLESLRSQMVLKSVLYDDFIRAFSDGYVSYVQETGPNRESQPAFQWYNWKDEPILFTQAVLGRENLDLVRLAYPAEYSKAKNLTTEGNQGVEVNCKLPVVVRESLEAGETEDAHEDAHEMAHINLGEPDRPRKYKTNGQYLPSKFAALEPRSNSRWFLSQDDAGNQSCEPKALSAVLGLMEVNGTCHDSRAHIAESSKIKGTMGVSTLRQSGATVASAKSGTLRPGGGAAEVAGDEPAVAPHVPETAAPIHSAGPIAQGRVENRAGSAPMGSSCVASRVSRAMSNLPPSSSMVSIRRTCSSSATGKPRPTGLSYLQKLKTKGGSNEARDARMRELGRAKRLSRGGSIASSHPSSR